MRLIDADELLENEIPMRSIICESTLYGVTTADINSAPTIAPETLRPVSHWKNAKTEPPPSNTDVEVYCKSLGVTVGYYRPLMGEWLTDDHRTLRNVTHWRPIPPPPPEAEP